MSALRRVFARLLGFMNMSSTNEQSGDERLMEEIKSHIESQTDENCSLTCRGPRVPR